MVADDTGNEGTILIQRLEIGMAAELQGLFETILHMAVAALDRAILMGDATIIAGRNHAIMFDQRGVAAGDILSVGDGEVAECRRQTVRTMLQRTPTQ